MARLAGRAPRQMKRAAGAIAAHELRSALGRFLSGVTVVTAVDPESGQVRGMTASAFTSVSLEPPLVLVSLARGSRMLETVRRAPRFGVSILAEGQEHVARHFAGRPGPAADFELGLLSGVPVLAACLAQLVLSRTDLHDAGDHALLIGQVDELGYDERGTPLAYFGAHFYRITATEADVLLAWPTTGEELWM